MFCSGSGCARVILHQQDHILGCHAVPQGDTLENHREGTNVHDAEPNFSAKQVDLRALKIPSIEKIHIALPYFRDNISTVEYFNNRKDEFYNDGEYKWRIALWTYAGIWIISVLHWYFSSIRKR